MAKSKGARHPISMFIVVIVALLVSFAVSLYFGASGDLEWAMIRELRLPRALLAFAVGAGLSVAGLILQALFANPLCEPYTLGISSGATLGAVVSASLGISLTFAGIAPPAFAGALVFAVILYAIARRSHSSQTVILLSGVMLGFVGSSLVALWMALADPAGIQGALIWLLGDLSRARIEGAWLTLIGVAIFSLLLWRDHRALDALLLGEDEATAMGVDVRRLRSRMILLSSLLIGLCVSTSGMIGFVGLLVPHLVRKWRGSLHLYALPLSAALGGIVLMLSDTFARVIARPYELPVGVVTALIGAPLFVWMMMKRRATR